MFLSLSFPQIFKKCTEHQRAFLFQDSTFYLHLMVEGGNLQQVKYGACAACLGVHAADDNLINSRLDDGSGAHLARL